MTVNTALLASLVAATQSNSFMWLAASDYQPLVDAGYAEVNATVPGAPEGQLAARATPAGIAYSQNPTESQPDTSGFGSPPQTANAPAANPLADANASNAAAASAPVSNGFTPGPASTGAEKFTVVSDFQPPAKKPRATAASAGADEKYPFATLEAPTDNADGSKNYSKSTIFVPSTKNPKTGALRTPEDMAFSLQSACSAANRRYADDSKSTTTTGVDGKQRTKHAYTREFKTSPWTLNGTPGAIIYRAS